METNPATLHDGESSRFTPLQGTGEDDPPRQDVEVLEGQECSRYRAHGHRDAAGSGGHSLTSPGRNLQASPAKHPNNSFCNT